GAWVPLDPEVPEERVEYVVEDAGVSVVVTEEGVETVGGRPSLCWEQEGPGGAEAGGGVLRGRQLAYVIYTSGSTGRPKGGEVGQRGQLNLCEWVEERDGMGEGEVTTWAAAVSFDASVLEVWPGLVSGSRVEVAGEEERREPVRLQEWLKSRGVTVAHL